MPLDQGSEPASGKSSLVGPDSVLQRTAEQSIQRSKTTAPIEVNIASPDKMGELATTQLSNDTTQARSKLAQPSQQKVMIGLQPRRWDKTNGDAYDLSYW